MRREDDGSALVLTLGYVALAIVLVLVCADATSLYLARKRVDAAADAAAVAGADGFTIEVVDGRPVARLTDAEVRRQALRVVAAHEHMRVIEAHAPDGVTARVRVGMTWRPPLTALFVPDGVDVESTATSRTALD